MLRKSKTFFLIILLTTILIQNNVLFCFATQDINVNNVEDQKLISLNNFSNITVDEEFQDPSDGVDSPTEDTDSPTEDTDSPTEDTDSPTGNDIQLENNTNPAESYEITAFVELSESILFQSKNYSEDFYKIVANIEFPAEITALFGEQETVIPILEWKYMGKDFSAETSILTFYPVIDERYTLAEGIKLPEISVILNKVASSTVGKNVILSFAEFLPELKNQQLSPSKTYEEMLLLLGAPPTVKANMGDGETAEIAVEEWLSPTEVIPYEAGTYIFYPKLPEVYELAEGATLPTIEATIVVETSKFQAGPLDDFIYRGSSYSIYSDSSGLANINQSYIEILSSIEKQIYDALAGSASKSANVGKDVTVYVTSLVGNSLVEIGNMTNNAVNVLYKERVDLFWLSGMVSYSTNGRITLYSSCDTAQINDAIYDFNQIKSTVSEIMSGTQNMNDFQILNHFNYWLTSHNKYNSIVRDGGSYCDQLAKAWTIQSSFLSNTNKTSDSVAEDGPVCVAYSEALKYLCNEANIPCLIVTGQEHMWTQVKLDEKWYGLDSTWNDPIFSASYNGMQFTNDAGSIDNDDIIINRDSNGSYKYFLKGYRTFTQNGTSHISENSNVILPDLHTEDYDLNSRYGWQNINGKIYYYYSATEFATGYVFIEDSYYYFDATGVMKTGLVEDKYFDLSTGRQQMDKVIKIDSSFYYFSETGNLYKAGWYPMAGSRIYCDKSNGRMKIDEIVNIDGEYYYFDSNALQYNGFLNLGSEMIYFAPYLEGALVVNALYDAEGKTYIADGNGFMVKSCGYSLNGKHYYCNADGSLFTGWHDYGNGRLAYYSPVNGTLLVNALYDVAGKTYIADSDGFMVKSCGYSLNGEHYYCNADGSLFTGWHDYGNGRPAYYSPVNGTLLVNALYDVAGKTYIADSNGFMVKGCGYSINDSHYFCNVDGSLYTGFYDFGNLNIAYYSPENGKLQVDMMFYANGYMHCANKNGLIVLESGYSFGNSHYYFDGNGHLYTGWKQYGTKWAYYDNENGGKLRVNETVVIDGTSYTFDSNGLTVR